MIDYSLKFESEAQSIPYLFDGEQLKYPTTDIIGTSMHNTAPEGEEPLLAPSLGYHVNVRSTDEVPELETFRVYPNTPNRVWA